MAKFVRPINTGGLTPNISNPFGPNHSGRDYAYPEGTPIYAAEGGKVTIAKRDESRKWIANQPGDPFKPASGARALRTEDYGNFVKIDHSAGFETLYAHQKVNSIVVKVGDVVKKGQLIGYVGTTGNSTGNHLHFEVRLNGQSIDAGDMFDTSFTAYDNKESAKQVAVDADVFEGIIHNSTEWDKIVKEYKPDSNPRTTQFEDVKKVISGYKSETTSYQNALNVANGKVGELEQEVVNQQEKSANIQAQCQLSLKVKEAEIKALKDASPNIEKLQGEYQGTIALLQSQLRDEQKAHGITKKELATYKNGTPSPSSINISAIVHFISELLSKINKK